MRKKPYDSEELFEVLCAKLKEKGQMPENLDYSLPCRDKYPVDTYEVAIRNNLDYGGSEGIYLDLRLYLRGEERQFGTFKTLAEDREGMVEMGKLLGNFVAEFRSYLNENIDDFTWDGFDVHGLKEDGAKEGWGYECATLERALDRKTELLRKYSKVMIRDNRTRKETIYVAPFKPFKTDDGQMLIKVDGRSYTFAEVRECWADEEHDEDYYAVFSATVDLKDYDEAETDAILHRFYPGGRKEVKDTYKESEDQIIAECIFEELGFDCVSRVSEGTGDEDGAIRLLEEYAEACWKEAMA